jgi:hypothetical protein
MQAATALRLIMMAKFNFPAMQDVTNRSVTNCVCVPLELVVRHDGVSRFELLLELFGAEKRSNTAWCTKRRAIINEK